MKFLPRVLLTILFLSSFSELKAWSFDSEANDSLDLKIGQMLMAGFRGLELNSASQIVRDIKEHHLGGVILFDYDVPAKSPVRNIASKKQLRSLVEFLHKQSRLKLFVAIDQEGGKVRRLKQKFGFKALPSQQRIAEINHKDTTEFYAAQTAVELKDMGINLNFAPVVDLNLNPENPIIGKLGRSYSHNIDTVVFHSRLTLNVFSENGIFGAIKHFPGHGSSQSDSHLGVVDVTKSWQPIELDVFKRLIAQETVDMVMTAHIFNQHLDPDYPATLSKATIQRRLRDELRFSGVVISDDLQMKAISSQYGLQETIRLAILAGVDVLLFANNSIFDPLVVQKAHAIIKKLVETNEVPMTRINESFNRIMRLKTQLK